MSGKKILIVGTGQMAIEYYKSALQLEIHPIVVGNTKASVDKFNEKTGAKASAGGLSYNLNALVSEKFDACFVAVSESAVRSVVKDLKTISCSKVIVEKPGAASPQDLKEICGMISEQNSKEFFIAYNRRFYASVKEMRKCIDQDGGIQSIFFDFSEVADRILAFNFPKERLENWLFLNSTHIIDLAFSLVGWPKSLQAQNQGSKSWHADGDFFSGFGVSERGIPFAYHSDWDSPGRWAVEVMTKKRRFILKPLEELQVQLRNQFKYEKIELQKQAGIKEGIFEIVESVINGNTEQLVPFSTQLKHVEVFEAIRTGRNYSSLK